MNSYNIVLNILGLGFEINESIPTSTTLTSAVNTFYNFLLSQMLGHSANTSCAKVMVSWLYATQAT